MNLCKLTLAAAAAMMTFSFAADSAEAGWRWRRRAAHRPVTVVTTPRTVVAPYSGISAGEIQRWRRYDSWYNDAYNGFRPSDFR